MRWSPDNAKLWALANKYGYIVQRRTLSKAGKRLEYQAYKQIYKWVIKPLPLKEWETVYHKNEKSAIVAQALYGDSFETGIEEKSTPYGKAIRDAEEQKQRFGFSLLVCDQYFEIAKAAGLAITDTDISIDEVYVYSIFSPIPVNEGVKTDTATIFVDYKRQLKTTAPLGLEAKFGDKQVELKFNKNNESNLFSGYFIERSLDSLHFDLTSKEPIVDFRNDDVKEQSDKISAKDSLAVNGIKYYYRIRGLTPFGELSPASKIISGMGHNTLTATPTIMIAGAKRDGTNTINWEFPQDKEKEIKHFAIRRTSKLEKGGVLSKDSTLATVLPSIRNYIDKHPLPVAYYQIVAISHNDDELISYTSMVQLSDSIPPMQPCDLRGKIDTNGVVHLNWAKNKEKDFLGYRVFRANLRNEEFVQITKETHLTESFTDTVNVQTLTRFVYYKLVAIDKRANPSDFSDVLELKRPDKFPPTSPLFTDYQIEHKRVTLKWVNSSSEDLDSTLIYRRVKGEMPWKHLKTFYKNTANAWIDSSGKGGVEYEYKLMAKDESGKFSPDDKHYLKIHWQDTNLKDAPKPNLVFDKDKKQLKINWGNLPNTKGVRIYRKVNDRQMYIVGYLESPAQQYVDNESLQKDSLYKYRIKVVLADNSETLYSDEVSYQTEK